MGSGLQNCVAVDRALALRVAKRRLASAEVSEVPTSAALVVVLRS